MTVSSLVKKSECLGWVEVVLTPALAGRTLERETDCANRILEQRARMRIVSVFIIVRNIFMGLTIKERTRFTNSFTILYINERNLMDEVFQNANIHNYFHMVEKKYN
jgi:hypothetical protein